MRNPPSPPGAESVELPLPAAGHGSYRYLCNGEATGVRETFRVTRTGATPTGATRDASAGPLQVVRSERTAPDGVLLIAEAEFWGSREARCALSYRDGSGTSRECEYTLTPRGMEFRLEGSDGSEAWPGADRRSSAGSGEPHAAIFSPLLRVFQGPAIAALLEQGIGGTVVVPALDPDDPDTLLSPTFQHRRASVLGTFAATESALGPQVPPADHAMTPATVRRCSYTGGNYDDSAEFWLDDDDRLLRYTFPQSATQRWEVTLERP